MNFWRQAGKKLAVKTLFSGGLITNYYCSSRCQHCLYACGPERNKDYMSRDHAEEYLKKIRSLGCHSVHIGGGEPMLNFRGLKEVLKAAETIKVGIDYIETNSSWFTDLDNTCRKLEEIQHLGVNTLLISISPFHNEYIPFYKVKGVMAACQKTGLSVFPWISAFIPEVSSFDPANTNSLEDYKERFGEDFWERLPQIYSLTMKGRPLITFDKLFQKHDVETILSANQNGCSELTDASHFHVDLYGNYIPGLCTGLSIKAEDLGAELSETEYPLLTALFNDGINGLYKLAKEKYSYQADRKFSSKCDLCGDIRSYLALNRKLNSRELQPQEFYSCQ
jgi:hypothetical protein